MRAPGLRQKVVGGKPWCMAAHPGHLSVPLLAPMSGGSRSSCKSFMQLWQPRPKTEGTSYAWKPSDEPAPDAKDSEEAAEEQVPVVLVAQQSHLFGESRNLPSGTASADKWESCGRIMVVHGSRQWALKICPTRVHLCLTVEHISKDLCSFTPGPWWTRVSFANSDTA